MSLDERDESLRYRVLAALDNPAAWPDEAAALYAEDVRWHCPARKLARHGREAALLQVRADAAWQSGQRPVPLRHAMSGERVIHESAVALVIPEGGIEGVPLASGTRVELGCTRLILVSAGHILEERVLETWTVLLDPEARTS